RRGAQSGNGGKFLDAASKGGIAVTTDERLERLEKEVPDPAMPVTTISLFLLALLVCVGGCESEKSTESRLQREMTQLKSEKDSLQTDREVLAKALKDSEWHSDNHRKRVDELRLEVEQLKLEMDTLARAALENQNREARSRKTVERLESDLVKASQPATAPAAPKPDAHPTPTVPPESTARTDTGEEERLTTAIEGLQSRLTTLRAQAARGQSKVSSLIRTTVDVPMQVPPNGMVIPPGGSWGTYPRYYGGQDGLILRRDRVSSGTRTEGHRVYQDYYYRYVPCGAAIKRGDFRTTREKEAAVAAARSEVTPLHESAKELEKELEGLKGDLAALRKDKK
ncbi:MAG TPA: hypothetical protein VM238_20180, partial [Phycisphaerae bacterium]|nr:hypothetical protein [Phycisphaerae bacterium]